MSNFRVISSGLNLRSAAVVDPANIKAVLPEGQIVTRIGSEPDGAKWWKVRTIVGGNTVEGFVSKSFLSPISTKFNLPNPDNTTLGTKLNLWSTFYLVPEVNEIPNGFELLDTNDNGLGVKLSARDWCNAALEGTVAVTKSNGETKTFNFADTGDFQVNCRPFFPSLLTIERTNQSRFKLSRGKFGEGVDGFNLVPYRSIAVDRTELSIGTVIFIPAAKGVTIILPSGGTAVHDGYFFAADVGGAIKDNHIDVFIGTAKTNPFSFVKSTPSGTFDAFIVNNTTIITELKKAHN